jgi:hypothetical protein
MILATSEETELLFCKWASEETEVACIDGDNMIRGRIPRLDDGRFVLSSSYGSGRAMVSLKADRLVFGYAEASEISGFPPEATAFVIASRSDDGNLTDRLTFITIPKSY